jgi:hypothetical protein
MAAIDIIFENWLNLRTGMNIVVIERKISAHLLEMITIIIIGYYYC